MELVQEVYKYLLESECTRDKVPTSDRSLVSKVLQQYSPSPKVALPHQLTFVQ